MTNSKGRTQWLVVSLVAVVVAGSLRAVNVSAAPDKEQEYFELRLYRVKNEAKQKIVSSYLEKALVPALNRMGIDRVGVFTVQGGEDLSLFVLIAYPTFDALGQMNTKLGADSKYQEAAKEMFSQPYNDPAYTRIQSRLMKAFAGMPVIEMPEQTAAKKPRIFELRIYEAHNDERAAAKVEMFNSGEIQLMRDMKMAPVFFGKTLISDDVPNMAYMLSASDGAALQQHWDLFLKTPEWNRIKNLPKYKHTVSKITNFFLVPTHYSQI